MGFLKRLLSLGGKKNKKDSRPHIVHNVPVPELPWSQDQDEPLISNEEEHEAAVGRLLRSSSARFTESAELNYANLPPLPHPINNVIQTPASSSLSIASTTLTRQGTYNVTVHKRRRHASTEPPVPPLPNSAEHDTNKPANKKRKSLLTADDSRVLRLRSDPSVASLLSLYDDHGKLAADAFSNDTPREKTTSKSAPTTMNMRPQPKIEPLRTGEDDRERAQVKRSGSTLRQLLGASTSSDPNSNNPDNSGSGEGDISWAERFLAETESASSHSSIGLETPITTHSTHFYTQPLKGGDSFSVDFDASTATIDNPAISSMEVEVSATSDMLPDMDIDESMHPDAITHAMTNSNTPRRASQVFDFLTRGKQSTVPEDTSMGVDMDMHLERTLPELPSCFSSPSSDDHQHNQHGATSKLQSTDPPAFTFAPTTTTTIVEDEDDTYRGLRVAVPALPDNTPRPVRHHHSHQRSNSAKVPGYSSSDFVRATATRQRSESQDLRSTFSDDSHVDINIDSAFMNAAVPFTPLVDRAAYPNAHTHVESTILEDQAQAHGTDGIDGNAPEKKNDIKIMLNGPTKVIVTAPTPGFNPTGPGRLPRGPRALPAKSAAVERRRSALVERSNSPSSGSNSASVSAWSPNRRRSGSQSSNGTSNADSNGSGSGVGNGNGNTSISDPFTLGHPRRRANTAHAAAQRVRSPSSSSINSFTRALCGEREEKGYTIREKEREKERLRARGQEKENHGQAPQKRSRSPLALARGTLGLSVKTELPATPMRSQSTGSRALLKTLVQQAVAFHPPLPPTSSPSRPQSHAHSHSRTSYDDQDRYYGQETDGATHSGGKRLHARTPSPTSSSEMSPVGRQMMLDVRQQRLNARLAERERAATRRGGSERRGFGL